MSSALIRNGNADFVSIEGPLLGAGKTDLIVPIPGGASRIGGLGIVEGGESTDSVFEIVALETGQTETCGIGSLALVADGSTDLFVVEDPSLRA